MTLVAVSGNGNDTITEIQTVSPAGMEKMMKGSNVFYVNITWTPTTDQGNNLVVDDAIATSAHFHLQPLILQAYLLVGNV